MRKLNCFVYASEYTYTYGSLFCKTFPEQGMVRVEYLYIVCYYVIPSKCDYIPTFALYIRVHNYPMLKNIFKARASGRYLLVIVLWIPECIRRFLKFLYAAILPKRKFKFSMFVVVYVWYTVFIYCAYYTCL